MLQPLVGEISWARSNDAQRLLDKEIKKENGCERLLSDQVRKKI
jgi:hypothetical protein